VEFDREFVGKYENTHTHVINIMTGPSPLRLKFYYTFSSIFAK
jgi:hypothetical protein